jgi:hypothetical protein
MSAPKYSPSWAAITRLWASAIGLFGFGGVRVENATACFCRCRQGAEKGDLGSRKIATTLGVGTGMERQSCSNLKTWLLGTHHGVSPHHLQAYLNEFVFRFNRRFYPMTAFNSALGLAAHASAPTYKNLYSGDWTHPAT